MILSSRTGSTCEPNLDSTAARIRPLKSELETWIAGITLLLGQVSALEQVEQSQAHFEDMFER